MNRVRSSAGRSKAGFEFPDALTSERYRLLSSVRGDLLAKLGRFDEGRAECERAAVVRRNGRDPPASRMPALYFTSSVT